jgi:hypothetical protein
LLQHGTLVIGKTDRIECRVGSSTHLTGSFEEDVYRPIYAKKTTNMLALVGSLCLANHRARARGVARRWIRQLDTVEDDWDTADVLWRAIEVWLNAHPVNCEEFLILFRKSRSVPEADSAALFLA